MPVNLRRFFPSETLRNFITMVYPGVAYNGTIGAAGKGLAHINIKAVDVGLHIVRDFAHTDYGGN